MTDADLTAARSAFSFLRPPAPRTVRDKIGNGVITGSRSLIGKNKKGNAMDTGIWATWYDVDEDEKGTLQDWMHDIYLPHLKQLPGIAWVAQYEERGGGGGMRRVAQMVERAPEEVGTGTQFVLLVGASTPQVFYSPLIYDVEKEAEFSSHLARRKGVRSAIFAEQTRVNGPSAHLRTPGSTPGPAIQMGAFRVRSIEEEIDLGCWYAQYRLPFMAQSQSCIAARKLLGVSGWAKHSILYEFTSLEGRMRDFEEGHEELALNPKEWTGRVVKYTIHAPGSPTVAERIWPSAG